MDLAPEFNNLLVTHDSKPIEPHVFRLEHIDSFLREAYTINKRIAELNSYLRSIRQSYLSAQAPSRRKQTGNTTTLTDAQRNEIDAEAKQLLRELNGAVTGLLEAEQVRQSAESAVASKKRARQGLGGLGRWAAGGAITAKSPAEIEAEEKANTIKMHRESIIWYIQRKLEACGRFQSEMMEIRITREVEKSKSALYKARGGVALPEDFGRANGNATAGRDDPYAESKAALNDQERRQVEQQLSPEQLQLFAQENQDMLKHYEDTLDQVRTAEKSLLEISELQSTLVSNLAIQQEHIDTLVQDSYMTEENVGKGNKELKRATERRSTAQMIFYATSAFCATLVIWDLLI